MKIDGNTPITLNLTLETLNVILGSLGTQPYDRVAGLVQSIQQQAGAQIAAFQAEDAPPPGDSSSANDSATPPATE